MKTAVSLQSVKSYEREEVERGLRALLAPLGGIGAFVRPGQRVLIKPNMLSGKSPEKAVTTHPEVVRAVIAQVLQAGGYPLVGDSPGVGSPRQVARRCGILAMVEEMGAEFAPFTDSVPVRIGSSTFQELQIARDVVEADVVINLPKLKTHQMMGMTCAVKNLFGAVIGMRKPGLHLQAGEDKALFARMLLELAATIRPALTLVDAITAMEGDGPGSGEPVHLGFLMAGQEPLAVDRVAMDLLGLTEAQVWTQKVAVENQSLFCHFAEIDLFGPPLEDLRTKTFRPAKTTDVHFGVPPLFHRPLKKALSALPYPDHLRCIRCGLCVTHCPPAAMTIQKEKLHIDYSKCIGCFCCQELCPYGAIDTRQGFLLRLLESFSRR